MLAPVVRYGISFKTALVLLDMAFMVKVFFETPYADELIVTMSVSVRTALAVLDPAEFVARSERLIIVPAANAGAV